MSNELIGMTIVAIRPMTGAEMEKEGWTDGRNRGEAAAIVLSNGTVIYPSCDEEGNAPGALFGVEADGTAFALC